LARLHHFDKKNKHRCALGVCPRTAPTIFNTTTTMNTKDLIRLGVPVCEPVRLAHEFIQNFIAQGKDGASLEAEIFNIVANPPAFFGEKRRRRHRGPGWRFTSQASARSRSAGSIC
jgi:hypothetical protein